MARKKKVIFESENVVATIEGNAELVDAMSETQTEMSAETAQNTIAGPDDKISTEIIKWDVKLQIDDERAHELGLDMAQRMKRIGEIERHLAAVRKEGKDEIGGHEDLIRKSAKILTDGIESKEMDCQMVRNFTRGVCYVVRVDTREVVETMPMEGDAAQMEIPETKEEEVKEDGEVNSLCEGCYQAPWVFEDDALGFVCCECKEALKGEAESAGE